MKGGETKVKMMHKIAFILVIIGGLNWLVQALAGKDILAYLHLGMSIAKIVYILVGLSALWLIFDHKKTCRYCNPGSMPAAM